MSAKRIFQATVASIGLSLLLPLPGHTALPPDAVYCAALGYEFVEVPGPHGVVGMCELPDGQVVDAVEFFAGTVATEWSYCARNGYEARHVDISAECNNCLICVMLDGSEMPATGLMGMTVLETTCGDGYCGIPENFETCPVDCPSGGVDGYCDGELDGRVDPDCAEALDPDAPQAQLDSDDDGVPDDSDAFPYDENEWLDTDGDSIGNNADPDDDNDGVADEGDTWPLGRFADVDPASHWAFVFIETLERSGVTAGCGETNYCPNATATRAQMAVFLERGMRGSSFVPPAATGDVFDDVPPSNFAIDWIEQLANDGITSGCGGSNYCPNDPVTRAQMAVFLLRAKYGSGYTPPPATGTFADVPASNFAIDWIEQIAAEGITSGCGGGNYCPNDPVTRAQMAVFLVRTFEL